MARSLTVYNRWDVVKTSPSDWHVREDANPLFEESLGSESAVREFWSSPAEKLGLVLFSSIYDEGFHRGNFWRAEQLDQVVNELGLLENYWRESPLPLNTLADLSERALYLRRAIAVARDQDGVLSIC
jgi:hypothetical protein